MMGGEGEGGPMDPHHMGGPHGPNQMGGHPGPYPPPHPGMHPGMMGDYPGYPGPGGWGHHPPPPHMGGPMHDPMDPMGIDNKKKRGRPPKQRPDMPDGTPGAPLPGEIEGGHVGPNGGPPMGHGGPAPPQQPPLPPPSKRGSNPIDPLTGKDVYSLRNRVPTRSVVGKFRTICKLFALFGFALSNQISDIFKINLFRNGLILFISIQSFGH